MPRAGLGEPRRGGRDHRGHGDPGHAVPRHRLLRAGQAQGHTRLGLRRQRRLLGVRLRPHPGRPARGDGRPPESAGHRRRRDDLHSRLHRSRHLRPLRRRRGGGAPGTGRGRNGRPRLPPRGRRLGRLSPLHAGGGQPAARFSRDRGRQDALHPSGGSGRLQVRGAEVRRGESPSARTQSREARRAGPLRASPGQPADHRRGQ